jgi:hypothetical protein
MNKELKKYNNELCNNKMSFQECELAILRQAVDESDLIKKKKMASSSSINEILVVVEDFLKKKQLVCYGGTAINNILPVEAQFYDRDIEIPDYDFFSPNALADSIELADIYYKLGYTDVEAKSGVHKGTFKVFVNFIPIADVTQIHSGLFDTISKDAITIEGIKYSPPDYLRMNMYLELSRPMGDTSRWEKVLKRLILLNKYYPANPNISCNTSQFQRKFNSLKENGEHLHDVIRDNLISQEVVFFGGYATSLFSKYIVGNYSVVKRVPDFDVLAKEPEKTMNILHQNLIVQGFKNLNIIKHNGIDELISDHYELQANGESVLFIYQPTACHSYNKIMIDKQKIKIASIDTILTFYLAFMYANLPYYKKERLLCMVKYLFDVEAKNRLSSKGLLKRFSIFCYGKQASIEEIRAEKSDAYKRLRDKRDTKEYNEWFLNYSPANGKITKQKSNKNNKNATKRSIKKKQRKTKKYKKNNDFLY